jgi:eukaryotic translation initiation factor 2C
LRKYSQAIAPLPESRTDWTKDQKVALRFFADLALKYNIKAGGINHKVNSTMLQNPNDSGPIFVGINVTKLPSNSCGIASVVANSGSDLSKWPGSIRCQQGSETLVQELESIMKERLTAFVGKKARPSKIIVYRGGVTEDQYQRVLDDEFPKIKRARDTVYSGEGGPKITMLIVSKGHQNRFHPVGNHIVRVDRKVNGESSDSKNAASGPMVNSSRPTPGTIIERKHDLEGAWDFFLQSHYAPDGIAGPSSPKPAHYIVIKEEEKVCRFFT